MGTFWDLSEPMWPGRIWAAAGAPNAVFPLAPEDLESLTGGQVAEIRQD